jgi:hypothetical protein
MNSSSLLKRSNTNFFDLCQVEITMIRFFFVKKQQVENIPTAIVIDTPRVDEVMREKRF